MATNYSRWKSHRNRSQKLRNTQGIVLVALVILGGACAPRSLYAQESAGAPHSISENLVKRLPAPYQDEARKLIAVPDFEQRFFTDTTDDEWRGLAFGILVLKPEGAEFLKEQVEKETSGEIRAQIFIALEEYFAKRPQEQSILEKHVSSDPDPEAALAALETLRRLRLIGPRELLEKRMKALQGGDEKTIKPFRDAYLQHYMWYGDVRLPDFAYAAPPVFEAKPPAQPVRVLAFGDIAWGSGDGQKRTANAIHAYHREHPFDFGITLGDNFYGRGPFFFAERTGLSSPNDPRWQTEWEQLYGPLGIKFYPAIGNGDYIDVNGLAAELAYTKKSQNWYFPAPYYTYAAGSVQFFSIDNIRLSDDELHWLDEELGKSKARWKVVYGHYHIYADEGDTEELVTRLLPVLKKNSVDVWINGHLHEMQELNPEGTLHFFVSGGGGAALTGPTPTYKRTKLRHVQHGFAVLEADDRHFEVIFVNDEGQELSRSHITK